MSVVSVFAQLTVANTAVGLAAGTLTHAGGEQMTKFVCRLETAQIRYRTDGTDPTATVGTILDVNDTLFITSPDDAARIRFIRTGGTSGVLNVEGFR